MRTQAQLPRISLLDTQQQWRQSRRLLVRCYFENNEDTEAAESAYKELVRKGVAHKYNRFDKVLNYEMEKWVRDSSVQNRPHSDCEPAVEDEVIKQFALKLGST
jgi:hypothetical protein